MINHELFAVSFGRAVQVMRDAPPDVARQKSALRAVFALITIAPATIAARGGELLIDDEAVPAGVAGARELTDALVGHGVTQIAIARGAPAGDLLALVRALAVDAGGFEAGDGIAHRVRHSAAVKVAMVQAPGTAPGNEDPRSADDSAYGMVDHDDPFADWRTAKFDGPAEDTNGLREIDLGFERTARTSRQSLAAGRPDLPEEPDTAADDLPVAADSPLGKALIALRRRPYGGNTLDLLSDLGTEVIRTLAEDAVVPAMRVMAAAIMLEPDAPEGSPRNSYAIALKRMLTKDSMAQVAPFLLVPEEAPVATIVLHRAGAAGADVLLGLLGTSESAKERRAWMNALRGIPQGTDLVVAMLSHKQWFVVRNVAELCGEMRLEEAVPDLAQLLEHADNRVQRAAAVALAKIGSTATVTPLLKLLKGKSQELRGLVAASLSRKATPALAMPIVALAADETNPEILREYYVALGHIGTAQAVQVLMTAAQPGGKLLGRRPAALRLAALEGLKVAPREATIAPLESLTRDADKAVATAAKAALEAARAGDEAGITPSQL